MENIFIDTSVFVADNFLEGNRIKELLRLFREGHFNNIMPLITVNEIKNQFRKRAEEAIEAHNAAMNNKKLYVLKNFPGGKEMLTKFPKPHIVSEQFDNKLDIQLKESGTTIIPYPTLDTTALFDKYFKGEKPFGKADKRHEFPDAMALESLLQWCKAKKEDCIVLSNDGDLTGLKHRRLHIEPDYRAFLDKTLKRIIAEKEETVELLFKENKTQIETELELWIRDKLDDTSLYFQHARWLEVHDIDIQMVIVSLKKYQITSIENEKIQIEIDARAKVSIQIVTDDESTAVRDSDDRSMHYMDTTNVDIEQEFEIPVSAIISVISKNDYDPSIEITEFNNGKDLEIEYDPYDY